jgi:hypothetical protein
MEEQTNYIVFQCYGNESIFFECAYALLSLSRLYTPVELSNWQIWVYTDNPAWFQAFRDCTLALRFRHIDEGTIKQWRGAIRFVHRVKLEILKDFVQNRNGNILYADTDVVFTNRIDHVFEQTGEGKVSMHTCEGMVSGNSNPVFRKLNNYLRENVPVQVNGKPIQDLAMWNAGVLGFNTKLRYLLDDALTFTDSEYPKFPKHIIEQFACSVGFQQAGEVKSAAPYIIHYWNLKEARQVLASFFAFFNNKSWGQLVRYSALVQMPVLMQQKVNFFQNRNIPDKLLKKSWQPPEYDWKEMEKQI